MSQESDIGEVTTEQLGFQSASGDEKVKLLSSPWSSISPSASLLSIASTKGLVAAAAPDSLIVARTNSVRKAFIDNQDGGSNVRTLEPDVKISVPRVNQVAFSSDENYLVIAADQGGGLAVYDVNGIINGKTEAEFQIGTNGARVQHLLPNPNPSNITAHLFGIVLESGQLLMADLKVRELSKTSNGNPIFHDNVTCACWSRLGKQIVAGKKDGTAVQVDPQGNVKAEIPLPPNMGDMVDNRALAQPIMSLYWIDTNEFLLIHTPINPNRPPTPDPTYDDHGNCSYPPDPPTDDSIFHIASRESPKSTDWKFQKLVNPTPAFIQRGRIPSHHFIQRLKDWPPSLDDVLILISTISDSVGMITKSKIPLNQETPVSGVFVTTAPEDTRRAGMPMSVLDNMDTMDTSPIGMAIDLSVSEKVKKPIPTEETMEESPVPLPALYVLNNEGILSMWYVVYKDSILQHIAFPDLVAVGGPRQLDFKKESTQTRPQSSAGPISPFGASSTIQTPTQQSAAPSFGTPAFGAPKMPTFGGASVLGNKSSPWGSSSGPATNLAGTPEFGKPAFGSTSSFGTTSSSNGGSAFAQVGGMGLNKPSVWGTPQAQQSPQLSTTPKFGQPSTPFSGNANNQSPFSSFAKKDEPTKTTSNSIFGGVQPMASFGGLGAQKENQNPWSKPNVNNQTSFGSTATLGSGSSFGPGSTVGPSLSGTPSQNGTSSFVKPSLPTSREETMEDDETPGKPAEHQQGSGLLGPTPFKLDSIFKGDGSAKDDLPKPKESNFSFFGNDFGNALDKDEMKQSQPATLIKQESNTEQLPKLNDIPSASMTPEVSKQDDPLTYKAKRFVGDLPPIDVPLESTSRFKGDIPPIDVPNEKPIATKATTPPPKKDLEGPVAGSPPVDLGNEKSLEPAGSEKELPPGPQDEEDEDLSDNGEKENEGESRGESEGENEGESEGESEGEDENEDEDEAGADEEGDGGDGEADARDVTDTAALDKLMKGVTPAKSTTPAPGKKAASYTPAGFPKPLSIFPPPEVQESPRSPSPQRSVTAPILKASFTQPSKQPGSKPRHIPRVAVPPAPPMELPAKPVEPTEGELLDQDHDHIQKILAAEPTPTKVLPLFLVHQSYAGDVREPGIGGQIEKVYRDINGMLDTLGLNAFGLKCFINGHIQLKKPGERCVEDLDDEDGFTLDEVDALEKIQEQIARRLEDGRLEDVAEILEGLREDEEELLKLKARMSDMRKQIKSRTDKNDLIAQYNAPLPAETQMQQAELRRGAQKLQKQLGEAEEALTMLRAKIASATSSSVKGQASAPSLEAVANTIQKMTAMIEKKAGDLAVLEAQIKRLPGGITSLSLNDDYENQLVASLRSSKLIDGSPAPRSARKKMIEVTGEDIERYRAKIAGRDRVKDLLREKLVANGVKVVKANR
ncbi:hypothetical protein M433DRAFT_20666 [Acidomyces richmondensis BFW]|nr:MAG: hypothetical protein FE78DRAFT_96239 [Acidomyces sp. 'richmondensis']KYG50378.1 hypothetical protein M433DRAFT_20666 [Acidomyces richmondensis BFW]